MRSHRGISEKKGVEYRTHTNMQKKSDGGEKVVHESGKHRRDE